MKRVLLAVCCAALSQMAAASYFAQDGISSLSLRSADLLESGQTTLDLSVFTDAYNVPGAANQDQDGYILPGVAYGLNESLSVGLTTPVVAINNDKMGLREVNAVAKYRLGGSRDDGVAVAVSAFAGLMSTDRSEGLGSGETGYGLAMNVSLYGESTTLNLSLGGEKSDIKKGGVGPGFTSEQQLMLAGGIEFRPSENWHYLLEGVFTRTNDVDDNFLLLPGVRYTPDERMSFYAGGALGVPSDRSVPEWRVTTGMSVNLGASASGESARRYSRPMTDVAQAEPPSIAPPVVVAVQSVPTPQALTVPETGPVAAMAGDETPVAGSAAGASLSPTDALLLQQIEALRTEVGKLINAPPNVIARVEIQNASGIRGLGEKVAKLLVDKGYSIGSISDVARTVARPTKVYYKAGPKNAEIVRVDRARLGVLKQSRIYYIEGFQQRATRVSLALPGSQRVMSDNDLVNVAEIRVVVGKDMKALLKKRPIKQPPT